MKRFAEQTTVLFALGASFFLPVVAATYQLTGCSSDNTGSDFQAYSTIYASLGKCHDTCQSSAYAFGIVQGDGCWCSNYAPGSSVDTSSCSTPCPGYPYEDCSSSSSGLFGYIALNNQPSGTQGSGQTSSSESIPPPSTVIVLATVSTPVSVFVSTTSRAAPSTQPPTVVNTLVSSVVTTATAEVTTASPYVSVKTVLGTAQTVTITPTQAPQPAQTEKSLPSSTSSSNSSSFWSSTGKVAGTFTVVGLAIAGIIGAGLYFFFRRWRKNEDAMTVASNEEQPTSSNGAPYMVDRRRSNLTLATGGLAGLTRGSSQEKSPVDNKTPASMSRRGSIPMGHDQRLNPAALWNTAHTNGSHASVASFQDERDYSRPVLHVRNPDSQ